MRSYNAFRPTLFLGVMLSVPLLTGADGNGCAPSPVVIGNDGGGGTGAGGTACPVGETYDATTKACVNPGGPEMGGSTTTGTTTACPLGETYDPVTKACVNPGGPEQDAGASCQGSVELVVGGQAQSLTLDCAADTWNPSSTTTALGYLLEGGPLPGTSTLQVYGCLSQAPNSQGINFSVPNVTAAGTFTDGSASVWITSGSTPLTDDGSLKVVVTKLGAIGDTIEGTFSGTLGNPPSQIAVSVSGSFKVCHIKDELTP